MWRKTICAIQISHVQNLTSSRDVPDRHPGRAGPAGHRKANRFSPLSFPPRPCIPVPFHAATTFVPHPQFGDRGYRSGCVGCHDRKVYGSRRGVCSNRAVALLWLSEPIEGWGRIRDHVLVYLPVVPGRKQAVSSQSKPADLIFEIPERGGKGFGPIRKDNRMNSFLECFCNE